jgi:DNA polymerase III subunit epsilon
MTELKHCFIDSETTGTLAYKHGIIQIAGSIMFVNTERKFEIKERFNFKLRPYDIDEINDEALAVSGSTRDEIMKYPEPARAYSDFVAILGKYCDKYNKKDKFFFTAYNAGFDNDFMRHFFKKNGDQYFGSWFFNPYCDIMQLALRKLCWIRSEMQDFKLATVAATLGINIEGQLHDAMTDIRLAEAIFVKCMEFEKQ